MSFLLCFLFLNWSFFVLFVHTFDVICSFYHKYEHRTVKKQPTLSNSIIQAIIPQHIKKRMATPSVAMTISPAEIEEPLFPIFCNAYGFALADCKTGIKSRGWKMTFSINSHSNWSFLPLKCNNSTSLESIGTFDLIASSPSTWHATPKIIMYRSALKGHV